MEKLMRCLFKNTQLLDHEKKIAVATKLFF